MRETEQFSIPMRDTTPHPTSTKAPKPSRWVTVAGRTVPGGQPSSSARASSWARRRERVSWGGAPSATPVTVKEMGFPTRERMAISRAVPSRMPRAASSRGMVPVKGPRFTSRSWPGVHRRLGFLGCGAGALLGDTGWTYTAFLSDSMSETKSDSMIFTWGPKIAPSFSNGGVVPWIFNPATCWR